LRIGVAGLGFGAAVHVPALRQLAEVELVALAGSTRGRAEAVAARLGIPVACAGIDALLEQPLDAVTLALPPPLMSGAAEQALGRGLAVLCEKPIAERGADALRLAALAANRTTAVDFQFAELATMRALKAAYASGRLGTLQRCNIVWRVESYAHRHRQWSWKLDAARGGGVTNILGAHLLYLVEWLFGPCVGVEARFDRAAASAIAPPGVQPAEDSAILSLTGRDGWLVTASVSNAVPGDPIHTWELQGTRGRARLANESTDYMAGFQLSIDGTPVAAEPPAAGDGRLPPFLSLAVRFVAAAREGRPATPDFAAGARVQALIEAIRAAAASGRRADV
jgi:predicted dehydrogenase